MAHHRRGRPKDRRAGCLFCKPWKQNGIRKAHRHRTKNVRRVVARANTSMKEQIAEGG